MQSGVYPVKFFDKRILKSATLDLLNSNRLIHEYIMVEKIMELTFTTLKIN